MNASRGAARRESVLVDSSSQSQHGDAIDQAVSAHAQAALIAANKRKKSMSSEDHKSSGDGSYLYGSSYLSEKGSTMLQDQIFFFLNLYRVNTRWILYNLFLLIFTLQSLPLVVPPGQNWGPTFTKVYYYFLNLRSLGLQFAPYLTFEIITGIAGGVYVILIALFFLSYRHYSQGHTSFNKIRAVVLLGIGITSILSLTWIYVFTSFWDCDTSASFLVHFKTIRCATGPNLGWGIGAIFIMLIQIVFSTFTAYCVSVTTPGRDHSFFALDQIYFFIWEQFSIVLVAVLRIVVIWVPYIRGVFSGVQAAISLCMLFYFMPFFRRRANSLYAGLCTARLLTSLVSFLGGVTNTKNEEIHGIIFGSIAPAVFVFGIFIGFIAMEVYCSYILYSVSGYEEKIKQKRLQTVYPFFVDVYLRFNIHDDNVRGNCYKLVELCNLYSVESCKLYITQAVYYTYFSESHAHMATKCLRKCFSFRPNIFLKFIILNRYRDLEKEVGDDNDNQKLHQFISQGKKKQIDYFHNVKGFWRHLLSERVSINKLIYFVTKADSCANDASRIYNNMMSMFNKRPDALRAYAEYLLEIQWDRDAATYFWNSADTIEEQEQLKERLRKRYYEMKSVVSPDIEVSSSNQEQIELQEVEQEVVEHSEKSERHDATDQPSLDVVDPPAVFVQPTILAMRRPSLPQDSKSPRFGSDFDPPVDSNSLLNERRRNRLFENHYVSRKSFDDDEDLQSADEFRDKAQRRQEVMHRLIKKQDPQYISKFVLMTVTLIVAIYLSVLLIIGTKGVKILSTSTLLRACRLHSIPFETLTLWRQGQANMYANASLDSTYSSRIRSIMTSRVTLLKDGVKKGSRLTFARNHREKLLKSQFQVNVPIISRNTTYPTNITLFEFADTIFTNNLEVNDDNFLQTSTSFPFMFLWYGRTRSSDNYWQYCQIFQDDYNKNDQEQISPIIAMAVISGVFHILFFICIYFPTFILFIHKQRNILALFKLLPREVLGSIFQEIQSKHKKDTDRIRSSRILLSEKGKIFFCFLLVLAVDIVAVILIFFDIGAEIVGKDGISSVVVDSGRITKNINRIAFQLGEGVCRSNCVPLGNGTLSTDPNFLSQLIGEARGFYANWKYGDASKFGKGIIGRSPRIDRLIREDVCYDGPSSSLDFNNFYCKSLDGLMESALIRAPILRTTAAFMNIDDVLLELNQIYSMMNAITEKVEYATNIFSEGTVSGFKFSVVYIYLILFALLLVITIANYFSVTSELSINREIRKMFNFVPAEFIDVIPEIRQYVHTYKAKSKYKIQKKSGKTKAILEASNDGVILCSDQGLVIEMNSMAREMFQIEDSDIVGEGLEKLFREEEYVRTDILELLKSKRGILKEYTAKRKSGTEFPSKLSMSVGTWGKKTVIAAFVRDCTIEYKQTQLIQQEKKHSDQLLLNILPAPVAIRLKRGETHISDTIDDATCFFSDMVGFTKISSTMSASRLVELLNEIVNNFDDICAAHDLEKIKTIGDAYFCVGGLHNSGTDHPERAVRFGLDIINSVKKYQGEIQLRCGCHTGPIVAGVIGKSKFAYDVWGDTVNMASRMESNGIPGTLQCSRATYERVHDLFEFKERADVEIKGKGRMTCYIVLGEKDGKRREIKKPTFVLPHPSNLVFRRYSVADEVDDRMGSSRTAFKTPEDDSSSNNSEPLTEESLKKHNHSIAVEDNYL